MFSFRPEGGTTAALQRHSRWGSAATKRSGTNSWSEENKERENKGKKMHKAEKATRRKRELRPERPEQNHWYPNAHCAPHRPFSCPYRLCGPLRPRPGSAGPVMRGRRAARVPGHSSASGPNAEAGPELRVRNADSTRPRRSLTACSRRGPRSTSLPARPAAARKCFLPPAVARKCPFAPSAVRKCFPWAAVAAVKGRRSCPVLPVLPGDGAGGTGLGRAALRWAEQAARPRSWRGPTNGAAPRGVQGLRGQWVLRAEPGRGALRFHPRSADGPECACALRDLGAERRLAVVAGAFVSCGVVLGATWLFFFSEIVEFQKTVGSLIELVDQLAKAAESEKMKVPCRYGLSCLPPRAVCVWKASRPVVTARRPCHHLRAFLRPHLRALWEHEAPHNWY